MTFSSQPGNVYVRRDPKTPDKTDVQIVLLDHGLYETISPDEREALCQLWKAIVLKDEAKMKQYSVALGVKGKRLYSPHTHSHTHTSAESAKVHLTTNVPFVS